MFEIISILTLIALSVLSWGFVDIHSPYPHIFSIGFDATLLYVAFFAVLFFAYLWVLRQVKRNKITVQKIITYLCISVAILFLGFPGFSYDVFNYMATAKVTYVWHENPYIVMPIEIHNEPMLDFMHAANKVALYGPVWIALTAAPHYLGLGSPLVTLYMFKFLEIGFLVATSLLIWQLSGKNLWALAFFSLNPIVLTESILSGHNDVVMMFFVLLSFYLLRKKNYFFSILALICSIFIKYATIFIIPVYLVKLSKNDKMSWTAVWMWSAVAMYAAFFLSPIREEIYAWYFIWPLAFLALVPGESFLVWLSYGFTFGLPYRFAPFIYSQSWAGMTPVVKKLVTCIPPAVTGLLYAYHKHIR